MKNRLQSGKKLLVKRAIKVTVSEEQRRENEIRCRGECCSQRKDNTDVGEKKDKHRGSEVRTAPLKREHVRGEGSVWSFCVSLLSS